MDKQIKNRWLQINKCRFNIGKAMDYKDYTVAMFVTVSSVERPDNDDGTIDILFKAKATGELIIKDEHDKVYIKSDKRSMSQKLRFDITDQNKSDMDSAEYYKDRMSKLIRFWVFVDKYLDELEKKEKEGEL